LKFILLIENREIYTEMDGVKIEHNWITIGKPEQILIIDVKDVISLKYFLKNIKSKYNLLPVVEAKEIDKIEMEYKKRELELYKKINSPDTVI